MGRTKKLAWFHIKTGGEKLNIKEMGKKQKKGKKITVCYADPDYSKLPGQNCPFFFLNF